MNNTLNNCISENSDCRPEDNNIGNSDAVKSFIKKNINRREIFRYLGYRGNTPDTKVQEYTDEIISVLISSITPKSIYKLYECTLYDDMVELSENSKTALKVRSRKLSENLAGCKRVCLFAATLGIEADKLLHKYELMSMSGAAILQSCAAAAIETYCDYIQSVIVKNISEKPVYLRPRFSPGYGDLALETQSAIFAALECTKRIGLTLTDSTLMYPTKSVTAFVGLTTNKESCHIGKCSSCANVDCEFRNAD